VRRWNDDPFTKKARRENYEARSVYKLEEIDQRERVFKNPHLVLDLGASPGSWTQYTLKRLPSDGRVIAVDLVPLNVKDPRLTFLQADIAGIDLAATIGEALVDLVLSDMAPKTSGIQDRDVALSFELASLALDACRRFLKGGGTFVVKLFMGDSFEEYHQLLKQEFQSVKLLRPESTRKRSREIYFIASGFRRPTPKTAPPANTA
jgi:23S rRNA (uridine2552-2'-O)-methyltransferase